MNPKRIRIAALLVLLIFSGSVLYAASSGIGHSEINSFEECRDAGYAVYENDNSLCITNEGEQFREKQN